MQIKVKSYDVGVIVGRFQVPELHEVHKQLIETVCKQHETVFLFLGLSGTEQLTRENPLDFEMRKQMILKVFPTVNVLYVPDMADDEVWSKHLDRQIRHTLRPGQSVVLYGGRDSFIEHYTGAHDTRELESDRIVSGTEIRRTISKKVKAHPLFREGVIHAQFQRFPVCYPTVDVVVWDDKDRILLGRKENEKLWRLPGGFAEPSSRAFEDDAIREVEEETGLVIGPPEYIGSFLIDDWRYRREVDKIKTLLFRAKMLRGPLQAGDDLAEVMWYDGHTPPLTVTLNKIAKNHRPLVARALEVGAPK